MPVSRLLLGLPLACALCGPAVADQTGTGPWNAGAAQLAQRSALVGSSLAFIKGEIGRITDPALRRQTEDAVFNPDTCVRFRAGLTPARRPV